ncbi:hypothetical protein EPUS_01402 [Endocarpon pusillum Z07020]|uniref:Heterokaryon incompatibility domain-containing protein n=1 Tax=Endocarpon pusillum (strain Z07020 / HMAS-L-300199) TaxID=1263415 RepID=U1I282_ENDPU|nr:uncharacterized protein EPUS_01402 [Endocarpon pusillum Z07020]ERF76069.1 hypothetical protein EPUS_01402 [Endocarpon pusillum Z07020]
MLKRNARSPGFRQSWPEPVDLLLHGTPRDRSGDSNSGRSCSTPSTRSLSPSTRPEFNESREEKSLSRSPSPPTSSRFNDSNPDILSSPRGPENNDSKADAISPQFPLPPGSTESNDSGEERTPQRSFSPSMSAKPSDSMEKISYPSYASPSLSLNLNDDTEGKSSPRTLSPSASPISNNSAEGNFSARPLQLSIGDIPNHSEEERPLSKPVLLLASPKPCDGTEEIGCAISSSASLSPPSSPRHISSNNGSPRNEPLEESSSRSHSPRPSESNDETLCSSSLVKVVSPSISSKHSISSDGSICGVPSPGIAFPLISPWPSDSIDETVCKFPSSRSASPLVSLELRPEEQKKDYPGNKLRTSTSIRLLRIDEVYDQTMIISCTLQSVDLADSPRYRTLSYTWGPATRSARLKDQALSEKYQDQQIICNDQPFFITRNLRDALWQIRQSGYSDWLWVDAICINQLEAEERAHQVSMMGQIYTCAVETVAWLGKDESGIEDMKWGIEVMIPKMLQRGPAFWGTWPLTDLELKNIFSVGDLSQRITGIQTFLATRLWFDRAWVAQEVALAPAVCILVGNRHFSWTDLTNLSIVLARVSCDSELISAEPELTKGYSSARAFLENINALRDLIPRHSAGCTPSPTAEMHEMYRLLNSRYGANTELEEAAAWLAYLLSLIRHMQSTEQHDKIYSVIGLAKLFSSSIDELIIPDYGQRVEDVYTSLTTSLLLNSRYLSLLGHVGDISDKQFTNLPSWVVDYSTNRPTNPILDLGKNRATHFDASLTSESPPFPRKVEGTRLTLLGAKFDELSIISPATPTQVINDVCHFEEFMQFVAQLPDRYFDDQTRTEVLWRAMMMDSEETSESIYHPPPLSFARGFQAWIIHMIGRWVADAVGQGMEVSFANESARQFFAQLYPDSQVEVPEEIQGDAEAFALYHKKRMLPYLRSIEGKVFGRKLFKTKNDLVGMGLRSVQAGDQVWLIGDSRTPLILRRKPGTEDFLLVGEAYLHRFMHGEMLDSRWDLAKHIGPVTLV